MAKVHTMYKLTNLSRKTKQTCDVIKCLFLFRYKAASILILKNGLVNMRLLWCLENIPGLRDLASEGKPYDFRLYKIFST